MGNSHAIDRKSAQKKTRNGQVYMQVKAKSADEKSGANGLS
jgi:hypothetical protein